MLYLKIILTAFLIGIGSILGTISFSPADDPYGTITIEVIDSSGVVVTSDEFEFTEDDNLFLILDKNYRIEYEEHFLGVILLCIEEVCTDFNHSYISIYINNSYSMFGLESIPLREGDIYSFVYKRIS